jgi:nitrogen fixation/metabolism regulation signal transduction histidine kinase
MLLIALGIVWLIHMLIIATNGSIYFVENNRFILWGEISVTLLIVFFAVYVLVLQILRLAERRSSDRRSSDRRTRESSQY